MKDHLDRAEPAQFMYRRPHLATNHLGQVTAVFWSPAFEGPLVLDGDLAPPSSNHGAAPGDHAAPPSGNATPGSSAGGSSAFEASESNRALAAAAEYYRAYAAFAQLMEDSAVAAAWRLNFKLTPGTCVAFNQRRLLHGRTAFSLPTDGASADTAASSDRANTAASAASSSDRGGANSSVQVQGVHGGRWLQGCYVSMDEFLSRYRSLKLAHTKGGVRGVESVVRAGNQCFR
jgi:hypothetical protein